MIIMSRFSLRLHIMPFYVISLKLHTEIISGSKWTLMCYHHPNYAANTIFFSIINTLYSKAVLAEFRQYFHYSTNNKDSVDTPNILFSWMTFELTKQNESE